jgi:hypothetical protein
MEETFIAADWFYYVLTHDLLTLREATDQLLLWVLFDRAGVL